jgi:hypothetical protein
MEICSNIARELMELMGPGDPFLANRWRNAHLLLIGHFPPHRRKSMTKSQRTILIMLAVAALIAVAVAAVAAAPAPAPASQPQQAATPAPTAGDWQKI